MMRILYYFFRKLWWVFNFYKFNHLGRNSYIKSALQIDGYKNIRVGKDVYVQYKTWLASLPLTGEYSSLLEIGDGCIIGNFNHIYATKKIIFGKNVLTADKVYVSDNIHEYQNIDTPIMFQAIKQKEEVHIGSGTWIGENVAIIGVSIGENCVIGANSVVTKSIPDYCIAVGNPAKIIKRYNLKIKQWEKTYADGKFK